jgi:predicted ArsR family transcriptional regulator
MSTDSDLASVSSLDDPVRRRLYDIVCGSSEPVCRDDAASAAGIGRALAVYHLDKLVECGLLGVTYRRRGGRSGPGAGRPAKLYARSDREFAVCVPPRDYELAARVLLRAMEADSDGAAAQRLRAAAYRLGTELTASEPPQYEPPRHEPPRRLTRVLAEHGYEPIRERDQVRLKNCPFHQLAARHQKTVCTMNLALIEGMIAGLGLPSLHATLQPRPGYCCVAIDTDQPAGQS